MGADVSSHGMTVDARMLNIYNVLSISSLVFILINNQPHLL
jgi:hypothetical protein